MLGLVDRFFNQQPRLRRCVTWLLEGDKNRSVTLLGARVSVNSIKEHGYLRAARFLNRSSLGRDELPVLMSVAYFLGGADAFVDAGANVGVYCALLQKFRKLGPMPFYAFEPNPDTYLRLVETLRGCDVETHDCALSDGEGHLDFVSGAVSHMFATLDNRSGYSLGTKPVRVACRRLDSFPIKGSRIAIKVDVEGHEWNVIQGASKLFDEDRVYLCYVDGFKEPRIVEYLQTRGFRLFDGRTLQAWPEGGGYSLLAVKGP